MCAHPGRPGPNLAMAQHAEPYATAKPLAVAQPLTVHHEYLAVAHVVRGAPWPWLLESPIDLFLLVVTNLFNSRQFSPKSLYLQLRMMCGVPL